MLIVYHVYFCLDKTGDWGDIQRVANSHGGQTSYLQRVDLKILKPACRVHKRTWSWWPAIIVSSKRSNGYLTVVLLCQHNHLHAALVLAVIHTDSFTFSTRLNWDTSLCIFTDSVCYKTLTHTPSWRQSHILWWVQSPEWQDPANSESWQENVGPKDSGYPMTQSNPHVNLSYLILVWQTATGETSELTSVSRIYKRFSTTTIFLTPLNI